MSLYRYSMLAFLSVCSFSFAAQDNKSCNSQLEIKIKKEQVAQEKEAATETTAPVTQKESKINNESMSSSGYTFSIKPESSIPFSARLYDVAVTRNKEYLVAHDKGISMVPAGSSKFEILNNVDEAIQTIQLSPQENYALLLSFTKKVYVYSFTEKKIVLKTDYSGYFQAVAIDTAESALIVGTHDGYFELIALKEIGKCKQYASMGKVKVGDKAITAISLSTNYIAIAALDGKVYVYHLDGFKKCATFTDHEKGISALAITDDLVAAGSYNGMVYVWDIATKKMLYSINSSKKIEAVKFIKDGRLLLVASENGTIELWDAKNGKRLKELTGHKAGITRVLCDYDENSIITLSRDHTARVWDLAGNCLRLVGHVDWVMGAFIHPDSSLYTVSLDKSLKRWEIGKCLRSLEEYNKYQFDGKDQEEINEAYRDYYKQWLADCRNLTRSCLKPVTPQNPASPD